MRMDISKPPPPGPVDGEVIGRSVTKTLAFILLNVLLFLFGVFLIWARLTDQVLGSRQITWWGLVLGIGAVLGAPLLAVLLLRSLWVQRRLVIGTDRLQIVDRLGG